MLWEWEVDGALTRHISLRKMSSCEWGRKNNNNKTLVDARLDGN